jgi:pilus assembly protein CpaB
LSSRVTEPGEFAGLTAKLEPGMRAFAVKVGVASGVSSFVQPDDFIDIYWTGAFSGSDGEVTRLIESSIKIIAVDNSIGEGQSASGTVARTVTVAGTPEQVARLAQAQSTGRLSMSLVGDSNQVITEKVEVDNNSMLGIEEEEVVEVEAKKVCTVKQGLGAAAVEVEIDCKE